MHCCYARGAMWFDTARCCVVWQGTPNTAWAWAKWPPPCYNDWPTSALPTTHKTGTTIAREDITGTKKTNPTTVAETEAHPDTEHYTTRTKRTTTTDANHTFSVMSSVFLFSVSPLQCPGSLSVLSSFICSLVFSFLCSVAVPFWCPLSAGVCFMVSSFRCGGPACAVVFTLVSSFWCSWGDIYRIVCVEKFALVSLVASAHLVWSARCVVFSAVGVCLGYPYMGAKCCFEISNEFRLLCC